MARPVPIDHRDPAVATRLVELQRAAYQVEAELLGAGDLPPMRDTVEAVQALELTFLAIVDAGRIVAALGYRRVGEVLDLDRLAVDPAAFRRGYGRALVEAAIDREDAQVVEVSTGAENAPARQLYAQLGFAHVDDAQVRGGVWISRYVRRRR